MSLGSPRFMDVTLFAQSVSSLDPLPGRDDGYDPVLEEISGATERTQKTMSYGLRLDAAAR